MFSLDGTKLEDTFLSGHWPTLSLEVRAFKSEGRGLYISFVLLITISSLDGTKLDETFLSRQIQISTNIPCEGSGLHSWKSRTSISLLYTLLLVLLGCSKLKETFFYSLEVRVLRVENLGLWISFVLLITIYYLDGSKLEKFVLSEHWPTFSLEVRAFKGEGRGT